MFCCRDQTFNVVNAKVRRIWPSIASGVYVQAWRNKSVLHEMTAADIQVWFTVCRVSSGTTPQRRGDRLQLFTSDRSDRRIEIKPTSAAILGVFTLSTENFNFWSQYLRVRAVQLGQPRGRAYVWQTLQGDPFFCCTPVRIWALQRSLLWDKGTQLGPWS
jgi:hypothetical protein